MLHESETTEFKRQFSDTVYKDVIAFANSGGGTIYVGMDDSGSVYGLGDVDETYTRLTNGIRDAILPDVTLFVRYTLEEEQGGQIIRVEVGEGSCKPYYLKSKGIRPGGVYVRQGASAAPASMEMIRRMIRDSDGEIYEEMRSVRQDLTFEAAAKAFEERGLTLDPSKYAALGIVNLHDGQFTNLGYLLSDQCAHTTKVAVFKDAEKTVFRDSREFSGSLLAQMEEIYAWLQLCNRTSAVVRGLVREEQEDYPEEALREAMLNALVHRDYGLSASTIINVNDSCMEFISPGGLMQGLTVEDIRTGLSMPRNRRLADIFHRLKLIEAYGTGIRRIYSLYAGCSAQPGILVTPHVFKLILPNLNGPFVRIAEPDEIAGRSSVTVPFRRGSVISADERAGREGEGEGIAGKREYRGSGEYCGSGRDAEEIYYGCSLRAGRQNVPSAEPAVPAVSAALSAGPAASSVPPVSADREYRYSTSQEWNRSFAETGPVYGAGPAAPAPSASKPTTQMRKVMDYLAENGEISTVGIQELLSVKQTRAYVLARQMLEQGWIESTGRGEGKRYRLRS